MSTTIIRTCDKCNAAVAEGEELWTLGIIAKVCKTTDQKIGYTFKTHNLPYVKDEYRRDYCRSCVIDTGMVILEQGETQASVPSLDELLKEIVEEVVQTAMEP